MAFHTFIHFQSYKANVSSYKPEIFYPTLLSKWEFFRVMDVRLQVFQSLIWTCHSSLFLPVLCRMRVCCDSYLVSFMFKVLLFWLLYKVHLFLFDISFWLLCILVLFLFLLISIWFQYSSNYYPLCASFCSHCLL